MISIEYGQVSMYVQGPAALLDERVALLDERDEMEGGVSARPRLAIPKPGEDAVRLLGEGGTWWGGWSSYPGMVEGSIPPLSRRRSSMRTIFL
jgi:hypothetical protein